MLPYIKTTYKKIYKKILLFDIINNIAIIK